MGKGNRNRRMNLQNEAEDRYNHPEKYQNKGKRSAKRGVKGNGGSQFPAWAGILATVLVAVILVGSLSLAIVNTNGVILRAKTALKSEHYEVTGTMMKYFYYYQYQNAYSTYYNYAVNYLGNVDYMSYFGWTLNENYAHDDELNNKCTLGTVKKDENGKEIKDEKGNKVYDSRAMQLRSGSVYTWWDYFMDLALEQVEELLVYCEAAYDEGYTSLESLNPEAKADIDDVMQGLKESASGTGYSVAGYISRLYGTGVTKKDVRKALELSSIASEFAAKKETELDGKITDAEIKGEYDKNEKKYQFADAITLDFILSFDDLLEANVSTLGEDYTTEEYNEQIVLTNKEYETRLKHLREIAPKFADAKGNEELFRDLLLEMYAYEFYFKCYSEKTDKDLVIEDVVKAALKIVKETKETFKTTSTDPIEKRIAKLVYDEIDHLLYEDMAYTDNDLGDWVFDVVEQTPGNVLIVVTETDGTKTKFHYPEVEYKPTEEEEDKDDKEEEEDKKEEEEDKKEESDKDDDKLKSEYSGEIYKLGAYYLVDAAKRDEYKALELGIMLVPVVSHNHDEDEEVDHEHVDPEFQAEDYLSQFLAGGKLTADAFEEFASKTDVSEYVVIKEYVKGSLNYPEIDEWAFGETSRVKTGDVIEVFGENTTEPTYYAVVYCFGEGDAAWYVSVKDDILEERFTEWEDGITESKGKTIEIDIKTLTKIG